MAGIYIHIPFCATRCIYCAFYSTTQRNLRQRYVEAVKREFSLRSHEISEPVKTIYLGGGTPSQLEPKQTADLILYIINKVGSVEELTVECNPDDITPTMVQTLRAAGVNRLSMGAQTFDDDRLRFLRRRHTAQQIAKAVETARDGGIGNISIDLMYGFPGETLDQWRSDIEAALALDVQHISAYCLSIEPGTPLERMGVKPLNEELQRKMYSFLRETLTASGFEHYEISNFARKGYRSRHNANYWNRTSYLGLGAAAHSFSGDKRRWNVADLGRYLQLIEHGETAYEQETIDPQTAYDETVMLGLRTCDGILVGALAPRFRDYLLRQAKPFIDSGDLTLADGRLKLTPQSLFIGDYITRELMWL